ncbi:bifunctional adenosylcobinamide kinase/adenosylcobinamide-phosphate guanylyltransferase [Reichenbachiella carrageenanivorans]|uniref:Adenosylcobinamide kinase n=1 Tax=Reichenbachiella carrageenanivorans TaxID=2979869 RepID=A0ABY6CWJ4_9BACT|nr:bifunctional adenosylcobinamide kinase/adenosylcobinamide-phosphate guanylyltransferase [Reichenbachiella carrageenanivorans]UXX78084.1 bifunctional adenosylcobinamide kinase/adenosylcobinamide-phosphate guanylyltransferase [Reichenbachiella carrageenanivorans]
MITYISGGERSGKSSYAQCMALELSDHPIYLATAKAHDSNFEERIKRHQAERDERWTNIEEQFDLSSVLPSDRIVVIDCVTLWLSNFFSKTKSNRNEALALAKAEFNKLLNYSGHLIFISNEIGMGLHGDTQIGRDFVEVQGWINQHIAQAANTAYFMVSGLPIKLK